MQDFFFFLKYAVGSGTNKKKFTLHVVMLYSYISNIASEKKCESKFEQTKMVRERIIQLNTYTTYTILYCTRTKDERQDEHRADAKYTMHYWNCCKLIFV